MALLDDLKSKAEKKAYREKGRHAKQAKYDEKFDKQYSQVVKQVEAILQEFSRESGWKLEKGMGHVYCWELAHYTTHAVHIHVERKYDYSIFCIFTNPFRSKISVSIGGNFGSFFTYHFSPQWLRGYLKKCYRWYIKNELYL